MGVALLAAACGGPAGIRHRVERGENLYRLGKAYGISYQELARVNGIKDPGRIGVGQVLVIPHATRELPVEVITPDRARADRPALDELPAGAAPFGWPVAASEILSPFGPRGQTHHDGIDIRCVEGTPVRAARAGRVLYSDRLRGYGNLVILEHDDGYATVYAHLRESQAAVGSIVRAGDPIGSCGATGKTTGANLHFELRKDNVARNPLFYLQPAPAAGAAPRTPDVVEKGA